MQWPMVPNHLVHGDGLSAHCPAAAVGFIVTLKMKEQGSTTGKIGLAIDGYEFREIVKPIFTWMRRYIGGNNTSIS